MLQSLHFICHQETTISRVKYDWWSKVMPHWESLGKYTAQSRKYGMFLNHWDWAWMGRSGDSSGSVPWQATQRSVGCEGCEVDLSWPTVPLTAQDSLCYMGLSPTSNRNQDHPQTNHSLQHLCIWGKFPIWVDLFQYFLGDEVWLDHGSRCTLPNKIIPCPCFHQAWAGLNITFSKLGSQGWSADTTYPLPVRGGAGAAGRVGVISNDLTQINSSAHL